MSHITGSDIVTLFVLSLPVAAVSWAVTLEELFHELRELWLSQPSPDRWTTLRLFLMPFCVSSFAALVKGKNFLLIFSPKPGEILLAVALCAALCLVVFVLKNFPRR